VMQLIEHKNQSVIAVAEPNPNTSQSTQDGTALPEAEDVVTLEEAIEETTQETKEETTEGIPPESTGLRANAQELAAKRKKESDGPVVTDAVAREKLEFTFNNSQPADAVPPITTKGVEIEEYSMETSKSVDADQNNSGGAPTNEGLYANQMDPSVMARRVTGKIQDANGQPLMGANLNIIQTNLGTFSDETGRFELFLPEKENEVDVSYSGYVDTSIKLRQGEDDVTIVLPQKYDASKEVSVQDNATSKTLSVPAGRAYTPTRPKNNADNYSDYLRNNSRVPIQENSIVPGREVSLEFNVNSKGRPESIRIVQSSQDPALDEEAIRLVRRGPDWGCEMDMFPCVTKYTIYFK
nr:TonB family protein [Bacteroidota bacterium]